MTNKFSELDLKWWEKEDLEDLFEEYPELNDMSVEQIEEFSRKLRRESQNYYDLSMTINTKADILQEYIKAIKK